MAALALTLLIEVPIYVIVLRRLKPRGWMAGVAVNLVTHPVVWLLLVPSRSWPDWLVVETVAWIVEFGLLWIWIRRSAGILLGVAVLANISSAVLGLAINR